MFYPKQKQLLIIMPVSFLINCLSRLTFRAKYLILQVSGVATKMPNYLMSFAVKEEGNWPAGEIFYFQTAKKYKCKNATIKEIKPDWIN